MSVASRRSPQARAQTAARRRARPTNANGSGIAPADSGLYAGLVTRAIALALDALIVNGAALLVGVTVGLGISLLHLPGAAEAAIAAVLGGIWLIWSVGYFVAFWSSSGQTPGSRVMEIRVVDGAARGPLKPRRALLRFVGLCLAAIPLLAGLVIMLWDDRRRCLQDRLARTVVVYTATSG